MGDPNGHDVDAIRFAVLRRRLETERGGEGTREYIGVLRLLEKHPLKRLSRAVEEALAELSDPRITIDTAGLSPAATELANRLASEIDTLSDAEIDRILAEAEEKNRQLEALAMSNFDRAVNYLLDRVIGRE